MSWLFELGLSEFEDRFDSYDLGIASTSAAVSEAIGYSDRERDEAKEKDDRDDVRCEPGHCVGFRPES